MPLMTRFWASAARVCWGNAGDDLPGGGAAIDKLKGRLGNNPFLFDSPGEGDVIADFGNLLGNDDGI